MLQASGRVPRCPGRGGRWHRVRISAVSGEARGGWPGTGIGGGGGGGPARPGREGRSGRPGHRRDGGRPHVPPALPRAAQCFYTHFVRNPLSDQPQAAVTEREQRENRERERRLTPTQPHKADSGAARTTPDVFAIISLCFLRNRCSSASPFRPLVLCKRRGGEERTDRESIIY